jgi:hypothetical protein
MTSDLLLTLEDQGVEPPLREHPGHREPGRPGAHDDDVVDLVITHVASLSHGSR